MDLNNFSNLELQNEIDKIKAEAKSASDKETKKRLKTQLTEMQAELTQRFDILLSDCNLFNYINKNFLSLQLSTSVDSIVLHYSSEDNAYIVYYDTLEYCNCEMKLNLTGTEEENQSVLLNWLRNNPEMFVEISIDAIKTIRSFKKSFGKTVSAVPINLIINDRNEYVVEYDLFTPEKVVKEKDTYGNEVIVDKISAKTDRKLITLKLVSLKHIKSKFVISSIYKDIETKDSFEFYKININNEMKKDIIKVFRNPDNANTVKFEKTGSLNRLLEMPVKYLLIEQKPEDCNYYIYITELKNNLRKVIVESTTNDDKISVFQQILTI